MPYYRRTTRRSRLTVQRTRSMASSCIGSCSSKRSLRPINLPLLSPLLLRPRVEYVPASLSRAGGLPLQQPTHGLVGHDALEQQQRGKKKKTTDGATSSWEEADKEKVLTAMIDVLELDLASLWKANLPEEEFLNLFNKVVSSMLEVRQRSCATPSSVSPTH